MGVCGTPWQVVELDDVWARIAPRIPGTAEAIVLVREACERDAVCLECADGVLIVTLEPVDDLHFRLFVLLFVGYRAGAFQRREPDLDALAVDLGASSIAGFPARRGWAKLLRRPWIRQGEVFTREVDHGRKTAGTEANASAEGAG